MLQVLAWWLVVGVLGIAGLPLATLLFANLPDRGYAFAKPLSLLVVGWLVWFPLSVVSALPFTQGWIAGTILAYLMVNSRLLRVPGVRQSLTHLWARSRAYILMVEVLFAASLAGMAWLRSFTPAAVDTEKLMDLAFLSAIWRAPHLPPPDPWLSGQPINYYYFGHYLLALSAKLLGTQPAVAFNLGIALILALTAVAVFGVAANIFAVGRPMAGLCRAWIAGLASVALVLVLGNLNGAQIWWQDAVAATRGSHAAIANPWLWWLDRGLWPGYDWWSPSRVVPNTINEFPAFSFVLADLHAHVLALPFVTLAVALALNLLLGTGRGLGAFGAGWPRLLALGITGIVFGALYAINGWDLPTYLGLALLALAIQQWLAHDRRITRQTLVDFAVVGGALVALAVLLYLPFYRGFVSPSQGIGIVPASVRSPIGDVVGVFGLTAFIALSYLAQQLARWQGPLLVTSGLAALVLLARLAPNFAGWTTLWGLAILGACAAVALRALGIWREASEPSGENVVPRWRERGELFVLCLFGTAAALVVACELVYLRDVFVGGADFRMNTVFKLYFQAWLLAGLAGGPALVWLGGRALRALEASLRQVMPVVQPPVVPALTGSMAADPKPAASMPAKALGARSPAAANVLAESGAPEWNHDAGPDVIEQGEHAPTRASLAEPPAGADVHPAAHLPERAAVLRWAGAGGIVLWMAALSALLAATLVYPVLATSARTANFTLPRTLDGAAYMATDSVDAGDEAAIVWLNAHVAGDPVIVEAARYDEYTHLGRVSAFTGLPTLLGWGGHEVQWRVNWLAQPGHANTIEERLAAVNTIYTSGDQATVLSMLHAYGAQLVYVGTAERQQYANADLARFGRFLQSIYSHGGVTIYAAPSFQGVS
jgi:YYY domain-containing protein